MSKVPWPLGTPRGLVASAAVVTVALVLSLAAFPALRAAAVWLIATVPALLLAWRFPNETKQLLGWGLGQVSWLSQSVEREAVRQDLEGTLARGADKINDSCVGAAASKVRVKFLRSGEEVDELPDGTLVVGIAHHRDRTRNLVAAAWAYARYGIIPHARRHLDRDVSTGIDFVVAKDLLVAADRRAVSAFITTIWEPSVVGTERLRDLTAKLEVIREDALLAPVVFSEFVELGYRYATQFPVETVAEETARFVENLYEIARVEREVGSASGDLDFRGIAIRCSLVLVAKPDVYAVKGPPPYRHHIEKALRQGATAVYLLARGRNVAYARELADTYRADGRLHDIEEFSSVFHQRSGREVERLVIRLMAAGPTGEQRAASLTAMSIVPASRTDAVSRSRTS